MASQAQLPIVDSTSVSSAQSNSIVVPPPLAANKSEDKSRSGSTITETLDPCCSTVVSIGWLVLGLIMFLIFVTIAGALGQDSTIFCQGYWNAVQDPILVARYQFSGHSKVAVWALLQGATFFFLGLLAVLENLASARKLLALREQLRTLLLLTGLFFIAWMIAGNAWIIGDETGLGVIPQACKDGAMGNRNLYHFCLALLIFLDIMVPITLLTIVYLTLNTKDRNFLNSTLGAFNTSSNDPAEVSQSDRPLTASCCTLSISAAALGFGLIMFLIFVTIAGSLGQASTIFCSGYWNASVKYQLSGHSTVAVWALLMGSTFFFLGLLFFLENLAASIRANAMRDRIRTLLLLTTLFFFAWLIAGNVWIVGSEGAMGVVPDACKDGNMGNRNLYHFCLVLIIMMDIAVPLALFGLIAYTVDFSQGTVFNKTLFLANPSAPGAGSETAPVSTRQANACCSLAVASGNLAFCVVLFILFVTIPNVLEPGTMAHSWDQSFCNGYWIASPKYQLSGHSAVAVWALLMGATFLFLGLLWVLENRAAMMNAVTLRDQLRTLLLLTSSFGIAWLIAGNTWIIGDETTGSKLGVVPQACKDGNMGNRNLYHFCLAIIIFLDITVPLALLAVAFKTGLNSTLAFFPLPAPAPVQKDSDAADKLKEVPDMNMSAASTATTIFVGPAPVPAQPSLPLPVQQRAPGNEASAVTAHPSPGSNSTMVFVGTA